MQALPSPIRQMPPGAARFGQVGPDSAVAQRAVRFSIECGQMRGGVSATVPVTALLLFGAVFAINSSLHSYLIVSYAGHDGV